MIQERPNVDPLEIYNSYQIAKLLEISRPTVARWRSAGLLPNAPRHKITSSYAVQGATLLTLWQNKMQGEPQDDYIDQELTSNLPDCDAIKRLANYSPKCCAKVLALRREHSVLYDNSLSPECWQRVLKHTLRELVRNGDCKLPHTPRA